MKNRQTLSIKQVKRLLSENVDLSQASMLWVEKNSEPIAVPKDFPKLFYLPDTIVGKEICPAPTLSDLLETVLPAAILTENNLRYLQTIQAYPTEDGVRYKCAYILHTRLEDYEGIAQYQYKTCKHDNALDAAYEAVMTMIAEGDNHLLQTHEQR